ERLRRDTGGLRQGAACRGLGADVRRRCLSGRRSRHALALFDRNGSSPRTPAAGQRLMSSILGARRARLFDRAPLPRLLLLAAGANCAVVFALLVVYGR